MLQLKRPIAFIDLLKTTESAYLLNQVVWNRHHQIIARRNPAKQTKTDPTRNAHSQGFQRYPWHYRRHGKDAPTFKAIANKK